MFKDITKRKITENPISKQYLTISRKFIIQAQPNHIMIINPIMIKIFLIFL